MKTLLFYLILSVSLFCTAFVSQAQTENNQHLFWVSPTLGKAGFPTAQVAVGYEPNTSRSVFTGRYTVSAELFHDVEPGIKTQELGLLYGVKMGRFSAAAGVATVWGNHRGAYLRTEPDPLMGSGREYEFVGYRTWGVPGEIRYRIETKYVGIGLTAFGNLNQKRSFGGLGVSLYFGKLK